jgi:Na+/glutamate symporter
MDEKHASRILTKIDLLVKLIMLLNVKEKHIEAGTKNIVIDALFKSIFILIISILLAYLFARKLQKVLELELKTFPMILKKKLYHNQNIFKSHKRRLVNMFYILKQI